MQKPITLIIALGLINLVLSGCASNKDTVLPTDGPSMKAIYEQHINTLGTHDPLVIRNVLGNRPVVDGNGSLHGYTREAHNEIDTIFPRLPNPTLVMYVFPHLSGKEQAPVPGYVTTFSMYERVEYALPGEVPSKPQRK